LDEREFTRGDRKTQVATLKEEMAIGVASLNDANRELGRRIVEGGDDIYIIATNNFTYGTWDQQKQLTDAAIEAAKLEAKPPVAPKANSKGDNIIE
jgi:hypothetical protein